MFSAKDIKKQWIYSSLTSSYENIADVFDASRQNAWREAELIMLITEGDRVLDLGCGNGRLLKAVPPVNFDYLGIDSNAYLLDQARKDFPQRQFERANMLDYDFGSEQWDKIYCLAAFHHLATKEDRLLFLNKVYHALKPGGQLLMTNWYLWQRRYWPSFFHWSQHKIAWNDCFVTWAHASPRYYHAFTGGELKRLLKQAGFKHLEQKVQDRNYLTVAVKPVR
ncbi:MAG: methyltransferase domain-containing protein [Candidatus Komeilibacteria bacterium]